MKIAICGSISHFQQMEEARQALLEHGHEVEFPITSDEILKGEKQIDDVHDYKNRAHNDGDMGHFTNERIKLHFDKIKESDAILVVNCDKNGIENYIGGNTLMEMGVALAENKVIYLLNPIPEVQYKVEIIGCLPIIVNGDYSKIGGQK